MPHRVIVHRRRTRAGILAALVCGVLLTACGKSATEGAEGHPRMAGPEWRSEMSVIKMAVQGDEADPARARRWGSYRRYLGDITGLPIETVEASDYNGVIQAISSGTVDMAQMGAGSYANVEDQVGNLAQPILLIRQAEGNTGYYSAIIVRADSPFQTLQDLAGHKLGYVDFNSTSGYLYPRWAMRQQGIDPESHFGQTVMGGGHTQVALALANGQVEAAVINVSGGTPETGFTTGAHFTLARNGLIDLEDYRLIWSAGPIPNSPVVVRADRPQEFIDLLRGGLASLPYEDPAIWLEIGQAEGGSFTAVDRDFYQSIIDIRAQDIAERRGLDAPAEGK